MIVDFWYFINKVNKIQVMEKSSISKLANSTFTSQFFHNENSSQDQSIMLIKNNRIQILHHQVTAEMLNPKGEETKPLLLQAAFHNSPVSVLYLLRRGANLNATDNEGKSVFHICAYTGHDEVLKVIRNEMKLIRIKELNEKYVASLTNSNYKRTDAKNGKLKMSVSEARNKVFERMQQQLTSLYEKYIFTLILDTFNYFMAVVKKSNRNCFHLGCLNRYQRCYNTLELMFEELLNFNIHLDSTALQMYNQVNGCFQNQFQKIDPRQFEDTIALIQQMILPQRLQQIKKEMTNKLSKQIQSILQSKDATGHVPLYLASKAGNTAIINLIRKWQSAKTKKSQEKQDLIKIASHNLARSHIMDLCDASKQADSKTMNFLLSCGEEINRKKTIFGTFALLEAVKSFELQKNIEPIRLLILSGADVNQQDTNGWTVLHHICQRGQKALISQIFQIWESGKCKKILINKLTNKNYHILHLAAMNNHPDVIQYLLTNPTAKKLEINSSCADGDRCTMLHHAARKGAVQALKKVLQFASDLIYAEDIRSNTALHYAAMSDHTTCIKFLLYFDSDFDKLQLIRNTRGKLAKDLTVSKKQFQNIYTSARLGDVNQVRKMITQNAALKKTVTPTKERTLLILGVINQHLLVVKYLVEVGVDITHKDKTGKTAKEYAIQYQNNAKSKEQLVVAKNILSLLAG